MLNVVQNTADNCKNNWILSSVNCTSQQR